MKKDFIDSVTQNYKNCILPYWKAMRDDEFGGFYGYKDFDLVTDKKADKGVILNSRILYFFSRAALVFGDNSLTEYANHAYDFLINSCLDKVNGGLYWMIKYNGEVSESMKHTYNQAFGIYALSQYYELTGKKEALNLALNIFDVIETKCVDEFGYKEAFSADFKEIDNDKLSENGLLADKTMNTLLHLLEAYSLLYKVCHDKRVGERLEFILDTFEKKVWNGEKGQMEVFFDKEMNNIADLYSYGHDIEASWLIDYGYKVLGRKTPTYTLIMAENVLDTAFKNNKVLNECFNGVVNDTRVWWIQAESIVGCVNAYEKTDNEVFLHDAEKIWNYVLNSFIDTRDGGEWFWDLDSNDVPSSKKPITEPWKCPYHNGRMVMEIVERSKGDAK